MSKIKVAICDDMKYICDYFSMVLKSKEMFDVVGTANNHDAVIDLVKTKMPDVVLLDLNFDKINAGIEMIPEIKEINPCCKVIIITVYDQGNLVFDAFSSGADSYLLKDLPVEEIEQTIIDIYTDKVNFSQKLLRSVVNEASKQQQRQQSLLFIMNKISTLSPREYDVLQQLYIGKTYSEISDILIIEKVTVRSYVSNIIKKMGYMNSKMMIKDLKELRIFENLST